MTNNELREIIDKHSANNAQRDLISRAEAIEAIRTAKIVFDSPIDGFVKHDITDLVATVLTEAFEALPSAEAVQGKWIHDGQNFKGGLDWCHFAIGMDKQINNYRSFVERG